MSAVRDLTHGGSTAKVAFEVERVEWPSPDRLEVVGRWFGVRGRRFIRPTLQVEVDGEPAAHARRARPQAVGGRGWPGLGRGLRLAGRPVDLTGSELTVGPDVAVELLGPGREARAREADRAPAARGRAGGRAGRRAAEDTAARARAARGAGGARGRHGANGGRARGRARARPSSRERPPGRRPSIAPPSCGASWTPRATGCRASRPHFEMPATSWRSRARTQPRRREGLERERAHIAAEATESAAEEVERLRAETRRGPP